jgi:hypothetical protein
VKRLRRPAWFVAFIAAVILLSTWFYVGALDNAYFDRSREPDPKAGWTTPYSVKGITVYVSEREAAIAVWLNRIDIGLIGLILMCAWLTGGKLGARPPNSN